MNMNFEFGLTFILGTVAFYLYMEIGRMIYIEMERCVDEN